MLEFRKHPVFGRRFARHLWQLTGTYWSSADARKGIPLLAGAVALELGAVYENLGLSDAGHPTRQMPVSEARMRSSERGQIASTDCAAASKLAA